jgi:hypothetical protein
MSILGRAFRPCERCGRRFVGDGERTAEENRDAHVNGDESVSSICVRTPSAE